MVKLGSKSTALTKYSVCKFLEPAPLALHLFARSLSAADETIRVKIYCRFV